MGESDWTTIFLLNFIDVERRIEETFRPWLEQTLDLMLPYLPPPHLDYIPPLPTSLPPPIYSLEPEDESKFACLSLSPPTNGHSSHDTGQTRKTNGRTLIADGVAGSQTAPTRAIDPGGDDTKPSDWTWAHLTRNTRVTAEGWWQKVREIELEFEDPSTYVRLDRMID